MSAPPPPPGSDDEGFDSEQTLILSQEQLTEYLRRNARTPSPRPQPSPGPRPAPRPSPRPSPERRNGTDHGRDSNRGLLRSSRTMMIATAVSRLTGFLRNLAIAAAIGFGFVADSYHTANTLPNIVYELLLGGVLTSVVVPLLVHAQNSDRDGGEAYTQRLLSLCTALLAAATVLAVVAAPVLAALYVGEDSDKTQLATVWAYFLLPQILFYGLGAMFGAVLNTRGVFGPPGWAPVAGNVVIIATALVFLLAPGPGTVSLDSITDTQILILGLGTTLGIVVQAFVLLPSLRRVGFRWRWRLGTSDARLAEAGGLALWLTGYVVISQVGYAIQTRIANDVDISGNSYAVFTNASLLFQMPYGIVGVSLLTVLMPRMSRAAARGDTPGVVSDLSLGSRLSAVALLPISALLVAVGPALGTVIFSLGQAADGGRQVGVVLAASAFGLVPFAITMLQIRVFYALKDARTPTFINVGMVLVKVALSLVVARVVPGEDVVTWLAVINSVSYVVGAVLGEIALRRRLGRLDTWRTVRTCVRLTVASAAGALLAWAVVVMSENAVGTGVAGSAVALVGGSLAGGAVAFGAALVLRVEEIGEIVGLLRERTRKGTTG